MKTRSVKFDCLPYEITCPVFGLRNPQQKSNETIVAELEREALNILGPWNIREYDFFVAVCCHQGCINRCLHEMGVAYETRPVPPSPQKPSRGPGNVGSDVLASKKSKGKAVVESSGTLPAHSKVKDNMKSVAKQTASQVEAWKRKKVKQEADLGSLNFMKDLEKTEGKGPWILDGRRWSMHYDLNQFGTMDAGSGGRRGTVAEAMVALHRRKIEKLVDEDSEGESKSSEKLVDVADVEVGARDDAEGDEKSKVMIAKMGKDHG